MAICVDAEKWICLLHCQTMPMMQLRIILYDLTIILSEVLVFSHYLCIMEYKRTIKERTICRAE